MPPRRGRRRRRPRRPAAVFTHGALPGSTECLSLNVFSPVLDGRRPVFVWLHGGGFAIGHAGASLYSGERLAADAPRLIVDRQLPAREPRLARAPAATWRRGPEVPAANWGLLDQIAAWSGCPDEHRGDSAATPGPGPRSRGSRRRPVARWTCSSPAAGCSGAPSSSRRRSGTSPRRPPSRSNGRRRSAPRPTARASSMRRACAGSRPRGSWPCTKTFSSSPPSAGPAAAPCRRSTPAASGLPVEMPGASAAVDVLIGHTAQEGTFFFRAPWRPSPPPERIPAVVAHLCPTEDPDAVLDRTASAPSPPVRPAIPCHCWSRSPRSRWSPSRWPGGRRRAQAPSAVGAPCTGTASSVRCGPGAGATHTVEVPLLFGTWRDGGPGERLGGQAPGAGAVAGELVTAWTRFVHGEGPDWAPVAPGASTPEVRVFGTPGGSRLEPAEPR